MTVPESREVRDEQYWRDGGGFRWCWPRFDLTYPADKKPRVLLNRYPHNVIGAAVVVFGRCWGVRWKASYSRAQERRVKANSRRNRREVEARQKAKRGSVS